jgi:hypothetical protein
MRALCVCVRDALSARAFGAWSCAMPPPPPRAEQAFGNAKTLRNENSSRFGKFILLQFREGGVLCGAVIRT